MLFKIVKKLFGIGYKSGKAKGHSKQASVKRAAKKVAVKAEKVEKKLAAKFKRTGVDPASSQPVDPAHSPGHRKMNWKQYGEGSKISRRTAARP